MKKMILLDKRQSFNLQRLNYENHIAFDYENKKVNSNTKGIKV